MISHNLKYWRIFAMMQQCMKVLKKKYTMEDNEASENVKDFLLPIYFTSQT